MMQTKSHEFVESQEGQNLVLHPRFDDKIDPDLQTVIAKWSRLPDNIKRTILHVIRSSSR